MSWYAAAIFMIFVDALTIGQLGYLMFPSWNAALTLVLDAPLACILSVEFNVIISSRVNDVRAAQQLGTLVILPLLAIFLLGQTNVLTVDAWHLLAIAGILAVADVGLSFVSRATFEREEILTKWK
jgi:ABC-2 type transport system permease protein